MVSLSQKCIVPFEQPRARKSRSAARELVILFSATRHAAFGIACLLILVFAASAVPLFANADNITLVPAITTVTGNGSPGYPNTSPTLASSSQNETPVAVTTDAAGNVYFADGNFNAVWKINRSTGIMAIFAGMPGASGHTGDGGPATAARFNGPEGLKFDSAGNLYIVDSGNSTVRMVDTNGIITTVAGTPHVTGQTGDGGLATSATMYYPSYVALDGANNLYIADIINNCVRRVDAVTHIITTIAGDPTSARAAGQTGDGGLATSALLNGPYGISFDRSGNLFITDRGNNAIRRVDAVTQIITTVAGDPTSARASGSTGDGGPASSAFLNGPWSVEVDNAGNLYISDFSNNALRRVTIDGNINTIAGMIGSSGYSGDGGAATDAQLTDPADVAFDNLGDVFIADLLAGTVRAVNLQSSFPPTAVGSTSTSQNLVLHVQGTLTITGITVPLSQGGISEYNLGSLTGTGCSVGSPIVDGGGGTNCILPVTFQPAYPGLRGVPMVVAAILPDPAPLVFSLGMTGLGLGPQIGFTPELITTVAGNGNGGSSGLGGPATAAAINYPWGVAVDFQGNLYISDINAGLIRRVDGTTQNISIFAGTLGMQGYGGDFGPATSALLSGPIGLALDSASNLYISDSNNRIVREVFAANGSIITVAGTPQTYGSSGDGGPATSAEMEIPNDVSTDLAGNLYIPDNNANEVRKVDASTQFITSAAGVSGGGGFDGDNGPAIAALLSSPVAVATDNVGNLYISDDGNSVVRKVTARTGIITTIAGVQGGGGYGGDGGAATSALLLDSEGLVLDPAGNLYITDSSNNLVREVNALTGNIQTIAGSTVNVPSNDGYSGDSGPATLAFLHYPNMPAMDSAGNFYFADLDNLVVRRIGGPAPLSFGSIAVGATSAQQDMIITNNGNATMTFTGGTLPTDFTPGGDTTCAPSTILAPAQSCTLGIVFAPTTTGLLSETLTAVDTQGSQSIPLSGTGLAATTSTVVVPGPNPSILGESVTLTATVSPSPTGSPLGSVTFFNGATSLGSMTINSSGIAVLATSGLPVGADMITAVYSGNPNFLTSTSTAATETINPLTSTSTTVSALPSPGIAGQSVALTATISPVPTGDSLGTVSFFHGATLLGTVNVVASGSTGTAIFSLTTLPIGADMITAVYSGNATFATSTSTVVTETINSALTSTSTSLSALPSTAFVGSSVTFTATVSPAPTGGSLGTVSFFHGATLLGTANIASSGIATLSLTTLPAGANLVTAVYSGNSGFATSTSTAFTETINPLTITSTTLSALPSTAFVGSSVTFTATVSPAPTGGSLGTVSFFHGATLLGTANIASSGIATLSLTTLPAGANLVTAVYSGNSGFATSTSTAFTETINPLTVTSTTLSALPSTTFVGSSVTFTATVSPAPTGASLGTISFFNGSTLLGTANVASSGIATLSLTSLPTGADHITAVYSGNAGFATSTSTAFTETINPLTPTSTTLSALPNPGVVGDSVTFTATVSPAPTGASLGTVSFFNGSTLLGNANVASSGIATFSLASLPSGADSITAVYSGNATFAGSTSSPTTETVSGGTTTALTASPNPAAAGASVTFTATVSPAPTGASPGTVTFYQGATLLGTGTINSSGVATFSITTLAGGADGITAAYSGNALFGPSTSTALTETVTPAYTVTTAATPFTAPEGGSVAIGITIPPLGGAFNNVVTMSATGLPPGATAIFNPPTVTPGALGAPTLLTIQLPSVTASVPASPHGKIPFMPLSAAIAVCCAALAFRRSTPRMIKSALVVVSLLLVGSSLAGCNGGFASQPGTLPGNYTITVTGTSGALSRSTTVTLIVP